MFFTPVTSKNSINSSSIDNISYIMELLTGIYFVYIPALRRAEGALGGTAARAF
jgi:hypothetical protein